MREILFRGKRMDSGQWVEAASILSANDGLVKEIYLSAKSGAVLHVDADGNPVAVSAAPHALFYRVDPDTLGRYTGLTDKNGRKIFEDDVCRFYGDEGYADYAVFWDGNNSGWVVRQIDLDALDVLDSYFAECCEVIGNIHDNPELLG